jgi:glutathione S-transferase
LILEELGIEYQEHSIGSWPEWLSLKPNLPFLQVPTYQDRNLLIVQSHAIYRHLARIHGLYGQTESDRTYCDIVEETIRDAQHELWWFANGLLQEKDPREFAEGGLSTTLDRLQRFLQPDSRQAQFWVGDSLTSVEFLAFAYLDDVRVLFPDTLEKYDKLREFQQRIAVRPRISEYLCSTRRPSAVYIGCEGRPVVDPDSKSPASDRF